MQKRRISIVLCIIAIVILVSCGNDLKGTNMDSKKSLKLIKKNYNLEISSYVDDVVGVKSEGIIYIEAKSKHGYESSLDSLLRNTYGEGKSSDNKSLPKANNVICDALNNKNITRIYTVVVEGRNGAKTGFNKKIYVSEETSGEYFLYFVY